MKEIMVILSVLCFNYAGAGENHEIYVASISWHTGLIVPSYTLPDTIWPAKIDYSEADYLEIGWGDRDFYQHPRFNPWYAFKAVFWPTRSTLHVLPLAENHIIDNYRSEKIVRLYVSENQLNEITVFLMSHFALDDQGKIIPDKEGIYYNSMFFAGSSRYYFPKNSNVWVATALRRAGFNYFPVFYQTTGMVVKRASRFGKKVKKKK